jgi:hypothetical protein
MITPKHYASNIRVPEKWEERYLSRFRKEDYMNFIGHIRDYQRDDYKDVLEYYLSQKNLKISDVKKTSDLVKVISGQNLVSSPKFNVHTNKFHMLRTNDTLLSRITMSELSDLGFTGNKSVQLDQMRQFLNNREAMRVQDVAELIVKDYKNSDAYKAKQLKKQQKLREEDAKQTAKQTMIRVMDKILSPPETDIRDAPYHKRRYLRHLNLGQAIKYVIAKEDEDKKSGFKKASKSFAKNLTHDLKKMYGKPFIYSIDANGTKREWGLTYNTDLDELFEALYGEISEENSYLSDARYDFTEYFAPIEIGVVFSKRKKVKGEKTEEDFDLNNTIDIIDPNEMIDGEFFPYINKSRANLESLQIFHDIQPEYYQDNCFVYACMQSQQFSDDEIDSLRRMIKTRKVPTRLIHIIAKDIKCHFVVHRYIESEDKIRIKIDTRKLKTMPTDVERQVDLFLYMGHFMIWGKIKISPFYLKNCDKIDELYPNDPNRVKIYQLNPTRYNEEGVLVSTILKTIFDLHQFEPIRQCDQNIIRTQEYGNHLEDYIDLNYDPTLCTQPMKVKYNYHKWNRIYYADFETDTTVSPHQSYMCCVVSKGNNSVVTKTFTGTQLQIADDFLRYLESNSLIYFHNLKYDICFFLKESQGYNIVPIERCGKTIQVTFTSKTDKNRKLIFRDSYSLITAPLRNFKEMFNLDAHKEIMPYKIYTKENRDKRLIPVKDFIEQYKKENSKYTDEDKRQILLNAQYSKSLINAETKNISKMQIDIMKYAEFYCLKDCIVLMQGLRTFNTDLRKVFNDSETKMPSIHQFLSISSIGYAFAKAYGCMDDVYEVSGKPLDFLRRFVNGGRCMLANNEKNIVTEKIQDFDAVSLYPSAMFVMEGIPKGIPKIIPPNPTRDQLNDYDTYFVEIDITFLKPKSEKPYKFPLVFRKENQTKIYTNDFEGLFYVTKRDLEDLEEFYDIEYTILRGYYFDSGFNGKINEFIKRLFDLRLKYKKDKNPLQNTIKLLMNSIYGKSIMKQIETDTVVIDEMEKDNYLERYQNYIKYPIESKGGKVFIKRIRTVNNQFNTPHFGALLLSWSKHLMNRVICTAEQNGIDIYYTDTDSIHIKDKDISVLEQIFAQKYGRQLIGSNLTQFHTDFEPINGKPSYSTGLIALGKKSYLDILQNDDGEKAYHIRMKGVPEQVILNYCKNENIDVEELYCRLYNGQKIEFDLKDGSTAFKKTRGFEQITLSKFKRTIRF